MSVKLMTLCFDVQGVTPSEKAVLNAMADNAWDDGSSCYPSQGKLAHKTSFSKRTVQRALDDLQEKGLIKRVDKRSLGVIEWHIDVDKVSSMAVPYAPQRPYTYDNVSTPPSQDVQQTVSEPSVEPTTTVIYPDGTPVPEKKICERCGEAPKAKRAKKYCDECRVLADAEWDALNNHIAVLVYRKREQDYHLNEQQVNLIATQVGNKPANLARWGKYLDYWLANGWNIGKNGLGNVLTAFRDKAYDEKLATSVVTDHKPVVRETNWKPPAGGV